MTEEELRTKLAEALSKFEVFTAGDGHPSIRMKQPWTDKEQVDALMPVVREALRGTWDDGFIAGEEDVFEHEHIGDWDSECIRNPWRDD